MILTYDTQVKTSSISDWALLSAWEEDELLDTCIIPNVEAVVRTRQ